MRKGQYRDARSLWGLVIGALALLFLASAAGAWALATLANWQVTATLSEAGPEAYEFTGCSCAVIAGTGSVSSETCSSTDGPVCNFANVSDTTEILVSANLLNNENANIHAVWVGEGEAYVHCFAQGTQWASYGVYASPGGAIFGLEAQCDFQDLTPQDVVSFAIGVQVEYQ